MSADFLPNSRHVLFVYHEAVAKDPLRKLHGVIGLWDLSSKKELRRFEPAVGRDLYYHVEVSKDGRWALTASNNEDPGFASEHEALLLWDVESGKMIRAMDGEGRQGDYGFSFLPDDKHALSSSYDNTVRLWDITTGQEIGGWKSNKLPWFPFLATISPDGSHAAVPGSTEIQIIDLKRMRVIRQLQGHTDTVSCVKFSPEGRFLVSGSIDNTVRVWSTRSGQELECYQHKTQRAVTALAVAQHNQFGLTILSAGYGQIHWWKLSR